MCHLLTQSCAVVISGTMANRLSRNVSLTAELDRFIEARLEAGEYGNASEVVRTALKLLREREEVASGDPFWWLKGRGESIDLMRRVDWASTQLGTPSRWSAQLRATVNNVLNSPVPKVLMWGPEHVMIYNDGYVAIAGDYHPKAMGGTVPGIWPEIWDFNRQILASGFGGEVVSHLDQPMVLNRYGTPEEVIFDLFYTPIYDEDGKVGGVMCTVIENTEKVEAQRALAKSESELRIITDSLPVLISYVDAGHVYRFANSFYEDWVGKPPSEVIGRHVRDVVGEKTYVARLPLIERAMAGEWVVADTTMPHRSGEDRAAEVRYIPRIETDGSVAGFHVLVFDIEDRVRREAALERQVQHRERAEEQLRHLNETLETRVVEEMAERRQAEAILAQSQKMETIGQLTGGVAHDFNNLLQVVSGNLQLLARDIAGNEKAETRVANAMAGVTRGAKLAAQLLAFGRRQALEPKVVNVTRFVRDMDDMLRRAIGEGIEVETIVGGGLWNTFVDPAQVENALLNLAINARDAMEGQGKLTIELGNASLDDEYARSHSEVAPGQYVMLAVTDTGSGIPPEIIEKVFDPFFSTKSEGKGSGLGLSMVYGFVKQSGGHVKIYSEVGEGTTIKLYFPRSVENEDLEVELDSGPIRGGSETVLVVEDDDAVRATVVEMLNDLGYGVLKAVDASSALSVIESGIQIDMLFTDVVMPGRLKSAELARMARERQPDIAVLFTSGYTENSIVHGGRLDAGVELLSKPYSRDALARKFRHVLANQRQRNLARTIASPTPNEEPERRNALALIVEDDAIILANTAELVKDLGLTVIEALSAEDAVSALQTTHVDVLITDANLPGMTGPDLAAIARQMLPHIGIIFATGDTQLDYDRSAPKTVLLAKPYDGKALSQAISQVGIAPVEIRAAKSRSNN
ncbi:type II toxin-antitoxin system ParD family antitoxin [Sphingobium sp.]|jgi:PAS domain S-box-containing protein|uniref:type II toxin-antitoxin system ParD family antitoxin n=2 Tax=Sphingobium TaxID=165695 RepID=UPI00338F5DED